MSTGSIVVVREYFTTGDPRFLEELFACTDHAALAGFAKTFYGDARPWARQQLERYVDDGCDRPFHRPLVKRVYKEAERAEDDALIARFAVAFDRFVKNDLVPARRWQWQSKQYEQVLLRRRRGGYPARRIYWELPKDKGKWKKPAYGEVGARFSLATRQYLRRRVTRYLRKLGRREPERFLELASTILAAYEDEHFVIGPDLLEAFTLVNLLYRHTSVLRRTARTIYVGYGQTLADLRASPMHPHLWYEAPERLESLLPRCRALVVRRGLSDFFGVAFPTRFDGAPYDRLRPFLESEYADLQAFGIARLEGAQGLASVGVRDWLRLLDLGHAQLLPIVVDRIRQHVRPDRLSAEQKRSLALRAERSVAELGFAWFREDDPGLDDALTLKDAACPPVRAEACAWIAERVAAEGTPEQLRELLDARHEDARAAGLALLDHARFRDTTLLWEALAESPYPEMRDALMRHLRARRESLPAEAMEHLWATTLLGIHRGTRSKRRLLGEIARRVVEAPERTDALLPLLRIALRSVRRTERSAALAAITHAALRSPAFAARLGQAIPELDLGPARLEAAP